MNRRFKRRRRPCRRHIVSQECRIQAERLEGRVVLAAGISFDARQGIIAIMGSESGDTAVVSLQGRNVAVSLTNAAPRVYPASRVKLIDFKGLGGDDSLTNNTPIRVRADGGGGNDMLRGGLAADDLRGGGDDDRLIGSLGNDVLYGGTGADVIEGGAGNDRCLGEAGADDVFGGQGNDSLFGGADDDDLFGDDGNDGLYGEADDDLLDGRAGRDTIVGGPGLDREDDGDDRFRDGDDDGDGYDNDHDRPVNPGLTTPITFTESAPGVSTAQLTGESAGERDKDCYSFTAAVSQTLTITIVPDANGRYAELEVKDGVTGRELLELEPSDDGIATAKMPVVAGKSYVIRVESPHDNLAVAYTVDLVLDDSPISPIIGTEIVFDPTGFAQLTGTIVGEDAKRIFSFTATKTGSLNVTMLPPVTGRYAELELINRTTRSKLLELEPSDRYGKTSGTVAVVAGQTYVIEIEPDYASVDFTVNLQLS